MIVIDLNKAKLIAHNKRRNARDEEFKPLDIQATIPLLADQAEAQRQSIRNKYAEIQTAIDATTTVNDLKEIINTF